MIGSDGADAVSLRPWSSSGFGPMSDGYVGLCKSFRGGEPSSAPAKAFRALATSPRSHGVIIAPQDLAQWTGTN